MNYMTSLLFLCPIAFFASFVDAVSGGGGLLSLPAFLFTGMPVHNAYACNKFNCCISTLISSLRYLKNGMVDKKTALITGVVTFVCSAGASRIVLWMPDRPLRIMVLVSMPLIAILILINKKYPEQDLSNTLSNTRKISFAVLIGAVIGFYDGMLGPGSGTMAILLGAKLLKYDLRKASGNAKITVLFSTLAATISYVIAGKVLWNIAIPVTVCGILGSYVGAGMAIKKGARFIRPMMLLIAFLMIAKMMLDLIGIL